MNPPKPSADAIRYRRLFETAPEGVLIFDAGTGVVLDVNPFLSALLGGTPNQFRERAIWELDFFKEIVAGESDLAKLRTKEHCRYENLPLESPEAKRVTVEFVKDEWLVEGATAIQCTVRDVTEHQRSKEATERVLQRLREAQRIGRMGDWEWDVATQKTFWSPQVYEILGRDPRLGPPADSELDRANWGAESEAIRKEKVAKAIEKGEAQEFESRIRRPDGRWVDVHSRAVPRKGADGRATALYGTIQDVSERKQAEAALRENEQRLRSILDAMFVFVGLIDLEGRLVEVNRAPLEAAGIKREEIIDRALAESYWFAHSPAVQAQLGEALARAARGEVARDDFLVRIADGKIINMDITFAPLRDVTGRVTQIVGSAIDVTERKKAEASLKVSEEKFSKAFQNSPSAIQLTALDGRILEVNAGFTRLTGYTAEEVRGRTTLELNIWENPADRDRFLARLRAHGRVLEFEARFRTRTGESLTCLVLGELMNLGGETIIVSSASDISARQRAESAARESDARARLAAEAAAVGIWEWNLKTNAQRWDAQMYRIYGIAPTREGMTNADWIAAVHPDDLRPQQEQMRATIRRLGPGTSEYRIRRRNDGAWRHIQQVETVRTDAHGEPEWVVGTNLDVTDRQEAEAALRDLTHRSLNAEDAERRRIAKELHDTTAQDLVAVMMNLGLIQDALDPDDRKASELIADSLALLENSANDIRTLAYVVHPPQLDETGLIGALTEYASGFSRRAEVGVDVDCPPDFARLPAEMEIALFRVVQESLSNVIRHSGSATATVRLAREEGRVVLEVADRGRGLPPELLHRGSGAFGVGITAMRERMQHLGGTLDLKTGPGGTTIRAVLPLPPRKP